MKRLVLISVVVAVMAFQIGLDAGPVKRYLKKETTIDMAAAKTVCVGWIDLRASDWVAHGYSSKLDWENAIDRLNNVAQSLAETDWLPERKIVGAEDATDEKATGCDLRIAFSGVKVDYDNYHLYLSIRFIDPKTNTEIGVIPRRPYYGDNWGFERYLRAALNEVGLKIQVEVMGRLQRKTP
jgi:hypothetical protein